MYAYHLGGLYAEPHTPEQVGEIYSFCLTSCLLPPLLGAFDPLPVSLRLSERCCTTCSVHTLLTKDTAIDIITVGVAILGGMAMWQQTTSKTATTRHPHAY